jgi:DNA polymerase I
MSKYGAAAATGKSQLWAADILARHRQAYSVFAAWQQNMAAQALFDERIVSALGWPMAVHAGTSRRTLFNYPVQATAADMMRLAAIAAHEARVHVCAPVHDAFWVAAPLNELDQTIATMTEIMLRASRATIGLTIPVELATTVRWPQCLGDSRKADAKGQTMWLEVQQLIRTGVLQPKEERQVAHG